jgi:hypothetical protein
MADNQGGNGSENRQAARVTGTPTDGVLVQICLECGKEYTFDDEPPPADLKCEKCGSTVFRSYFEPLVEDDVEADFRETTERDLATSDPEGEATRGDILDLNNL